MELAAATTSSSVCERDHGEDGAEDLLLRQVHVLAHLIEDGRGDEVAGGELALADAAATGDELGALVGGTLAVGEDAIGLGGRDDRAHLRLVLQGIADADLAGAGDEIAEEAVVDVLMEEEAGAGGAALAGVGEDGEEGAVDRLVEIGVREDDVRALAAQLQGDLLDGAGGQLHDAAAGRPSRR